MPIISICLPVYNGAPFLAQAIESILAQSFSDFELLIADDGSKDSSVDIAKGFASKDKRIVFWSNPTNLGLFANYNECLKRAQGKFIKPFAQDDILYPDCLASMLKVLEQHKDISLVSCARNWIGADSVVLKPIHPFTSDREIAGRDVILWHLIQLSNWVGEPSTVMFPAQWKGTGFDTSFYHFGDIEYWIRILEHGNYSYLNQSLCAFRRHSTSASTLNHNSLRFALDALRLGHLHSKYLEAIGETQEHFHKRVTEYIAVEIDHLAKKEGLTPKELAAATQTTQAPDILRQELLGMKEIILHSSEYIVELLRELDHLKRCRQGDHANFEREVAKLQSTFSWKITEPLRKVRSIFKSEEDATAPDPNVELVNRGGK